MAFDLGAARMAVIPSFRGFRRAVVTEAQSAGTEGGRGFGKAMGAASEIAGGQAGRGFARGFSKASSVDSALRAVEAQVRKSAQAVETARRGEADAAGRVRIAETQLAEARAKYAEGSSQVVRAEERLAQAQRNHEAAQARLADATERHTHAQRGLESALAAVGSRGGELSTLGRVFEPLKAQIDQAGAGVRRFVETSQLMAPVRGMIEGVSNAFTVVKGVATGMGSVVLKPLAADFASWARGAIDRVDDVARSIPGVGRAMDAIGSGVSRAAGFFSALGESGRRMAGEVWNAVAPLGGRIAESLGNGFRAAVDAAGRAASAIGGAFQNVVGGVMGAGISGLIASLAGGFKRFKSVEEATAKMRGFGIASETVKTVMDDVRDAVTDTMYTTGDMAGIAAQALVAGIAPGEQLNALMGAVKNTAAATGSELSEIGDIMSKVAASGSAKTLELNQLQQRGIPIWNLLAKSMNKTVDEVRDLAREGIDLDTVVNTLNDSMGDMAAEMGSTTSASIANMMSSFSRFGEVLGAETFPGISAVADAIKEVMNLAIALISPIKEAFGFNEITPAIEKIREFTERVREFTAFIKGGGSEAEGAVAGIVERVKDLAPMFGLAAAAALPMLGGLLSRLPVVGNLMSGLGGGLMSGLAPIIGVGGLAAVLAIEPGKFESGLTSIVDMVSNGADSILSSLSGMIERFVPVIAENLQANLPTLVEGLLSLLLGLVTAVSQALPTIVSAVLTLVPAIINALMAALPMLIEGGIALLTGLIEAATIILPDVITAVTEAIPMIIIGLISALPALLEGALTLFMALIEAVVIILPDLLTAVIDMVPVLIEGLLSQLPLLIMSAIDLFLGLITGLLRALPDIVTALINAIPQLATALVSQLPTIIVAAIELILGIVTAIVQATPEIISALIALIPQLVTAIIGAIPQLISAGRDLIVGLAQGIGNAASLVMDAIGGVVTGAIDWAKGLLGIKSPSRVFAAIGADVGAGLERGLEGAERSVAKAAGSLASVTEGAFAGLDHDRVIRADARVVGAVHGLRGGGLSGASVAPVVVSLEGATLVGRIDGEPFELLVERQLVRATRSVSRDRLRARVGV